MGKLIYSAITSIDGYVADEHGDFAWAEPDEDVHSYINEIEKQTQLIIYGRKMYEIMVAWENIENLERLPEYIREFALDWRRTNKIVYSRTLKSPSSSNTVVRTRFDPEEIRKLKAETQGNIGIGGPDIAYSAMMHDLIDEIYLYIHPVIIGNGNSAIRKGSASKMTLIEVKSFACGVVSLHYGRSR
jgi:dihydrofolate reductase